MKHLFILLVVSIVINSCDLKRFLPPEVQSLDDRIVLVNAANEDRVGLAKLIDSINSFQPAVIGIDLMFLDSASEKSDFLLETAFSKVKNLVFAQTPYSYSTRRFSQYGINGHTVLNVDSKTHMCESFKPQLEINGEVVHAFSIEILRRYSSSVSNAVQVDKELRIEFSGDLVDYGATRHGSRYMAYDKYEFDELFLDLSAIKGKIVIVGYLGEIIGDREYCKGYSFITPFNNTFRKASPDMWGSVVHANILSMLLDQYEPTKQ